MARKQRKRLIADVVEAEQGREVALLEQLEETVAELEGPRVDEDAFARMTPGDVDIVRAVVFGESAADEIEDDESDEDWPASEADPEAERQELLDEIARLEDEIARSRSRRDALQRYLDALDG